MTHKKHSDWQSAEFCKKYLSAVNISTGDVHYGISSPGERRLRLMGKPENLRGKNVLEIGCGAAQNCIALSKAGAQCIGFDISRHMLKEAARLARRNRVRIRLLRGDAKDLCDILKANNVRPKDMFDMVLSVYSAGFICKNACDFTHFLGQIENCLVIKGTFILCLPHPKIEHLQGLCREFTETIFSINAVMECLLFNGFNVERVVEQYIECPAKMEKEGIENYPFLLKNHCASKTQKPNSIIYVARKS